MELLIIYKGLDHYLVRIICQFVIIFSFKNSPNKITLM